MTKKRSGEPWMSGAAYGRSLNGLTINLLVRDVGRAVAFQTEVLDAELIYSDVDFAVLRAAGSEWMLHADHTYDGHPMRADLTPEGRRGSGLEIRLHGVDPDKAEHNARARGDTVLEAATDKGHGLREAFIRDSEGYVWVPDRPTADG